MHLEGALVPIWLIKQLALSFRLFVLSFLPFDVEPDLFLIQPNRAHAIASCPKMTPPIASAQLFVLMKEPQGQFAFEKPHELRHRVLGWKRHHQMNMIRLNVQLQHFDFIFLLTELIDLLSHLVQCHS